MINVPEPACTVQRLVVRLVGSGDHYTRRLTLQGFGLDDPSWFPPVSDFCFWKKIFGLGPDCFRGVPLCVMFWTWSATRQSVHRESYVAVSRLSASSVQNDSCGSQASIEPRIARVHQQKACKHAAFPLPTITFLIQRTPLLTSSSRIHPRECPYPPSTDIHRWCMPTNLQPWFMTTTPPMMTLLLVRFAYRAACVAPGHGLFRRLSYEGATKLRVQAHSPLDATRKQLVRAVPLRG